MEALYIALGVLIGIAGIFALAAWSAKKDNNKFDSSESPDKNVLSVSDSLFQWTQTTQTTVTVHDEARGRRKKKEKTLKEKLQDALDEEDYDTAAKLRDEIAKTKNK